jgi:hypothetical protein
MGGVEPMNEVEIMDKQAKLIEDQRRLFKCTVEQFKLDLTYLKGVLTILAIEHKETKYISENGLMFVREHIGEMLSMLNDFDVRMKDHE